MLSILEVGGGGAWLLWCGRLLEYFPNREDATAEMEFLLRK